MTPIKKLIFKGLAYYGMLRAGLWALNLTANVLVKSFRALQSHKSIYASKDQTAKPSYALITGGSGGLGFEFATQLAAKGFNIILIARDLSKLEVGAQQLRDKYNVLVKCIKFDFSKGGDPAAWVQFAQDLEGLDIAILVNNLGAYGWVPFEKQEENAIQMLLENCVYGVTLMTRMVLPNMLKREEKSAIINVGSFAGEIIAPTTAVNCASKTYIHRLTIALAREYENTNIDFLALILGLTATPGLAEWKAGRKSLVSTPEEAAAAALEHVKTANLRGNVTFGTWKHTLFAKLHTNSFTRRWWIKRTYGLTV